MAKILLQTQIDGIHPDGSTYYNKLEETLIEANKISANTLADALTKRLKGYRIKRQHIGLSLQDLNLWLLNRHPKYDGTEYLRIIDKDETNRSLKWLIKHIEWGIQH